MSDAKKNGVASSEDFERAYEQRAKPEKVTLPISGFTVLLRRPNPLRVLLQAERLAKIGDLSAASPEDRKQYACVLVSVVNDALVHPKLSLTPGENEIDPNWLPQEDAEFLVNWGLGIVPDEVHRDDLNSFRDEPGAGAARGASGRDVALPTERDPEPGGGDSPAS